MENNDFYKRYNRQILLKNFGETGQQKLLDAKVLVIGAGGLGCPILQYLAAAGIGTIGIVDGDTVDLSNLQRQILFATNDIGKQKATIAAERIRAINPTILVNEHSQFLSTENALDLFKNYDIIVDGTDNFATRYMINDACVLLNKPLVFGAVYQFEGQVAIFNVPDANGVKINYRHLFPVPPSKEEAPDCATAGVLGTLPGIIGMMQATETIKLVANIGKPLINKMVSYNALTNESFTTDLSAAANVKIDLPKTETEFKAFNYDFFCNTVPSQVQQIDAKTFNEFLKDENIAIIDVREIDEKPLAIFRHIAIPLSNFKSEIENIDAKKVVLFCQSGKRSNTAAEFLLEKNKIASVYNLRNGILSLY